MNLLGMEPQVVFPGLLEGQKLVLPVVSAHENFVAVGGSEFHGQQLGLPDFFLAAVGPHIAAFLQFLPNLLQLRLGVCPVQLLQHALQVVPLRLGNGKLVGQFFLRIFHTGVILVEFCRILLGGQNRGNGNFDDGHILVIKILGLQHRFALFDGVDVGRDDVPQLPQPLPVVGGFQFLLLDRHFPVQPGHQIGNGFPQGAAFLAHGVPPVPEGVKPVQHRREALTLFAGPVLPDGQEGKLLHTAVGPGGKIGGRVGKVQGKIGAELFCQARQIRPGEPAVPIPQGGQGCLPADQGRQPT